MYTIFMSKSVANSWKHSAIPANHYEKNGTDFFIYLLAIRKNTIYKLIWWLYKVCYDTMYYYDVV